MTLSNSAVFTQTARTYRAAINNIAASSWRFLHSGFPGGGSGVQGSKVVAVSGTSTDSSARDVQLAIAKTATVTITIATPGVVAWAGHMFANGNQIVFQTTGALPTGLTAGATYYVINSDTVAGTFQLSATYDGTAINTSGSQSGVHTGYIIRPLGCASVAATAGTVSTVASADFFSSSYIPGLPIGPDGEKYIYLEAGDWLCASALTTVTSGKIIQITAIAADF